MNETMTTQTERTISHLEELSELFNQFSVELKAKTEQAEKDGTGMADYYRGSWWAYENAAGALSGQLQTYRNIQTAIIEAMKK